MYWFQRDAAAPGERCCLSSTSARWVSLALARAHVVSAMRSSAGPSQVPGAMRMGSVVGPVTPTPRYGPEA